MAQPKIRTDIPLETGYTNAPKEHVEGINKQVAAQTNLAKDAEKRAFTPPKETSPAKT